MRIGNPLPQILTTIQVGGITAVVTAAIQVGSTISSAADVQVQGASATQLVALNTNRSSAIVSNVSGTKYARVGDASITATRGARVPPNASAVLDTKAAISGLSEDGTTITLAVVELST